MIMGLIPLITLDTLFNVSNCEVEFRGPLKAKVSSRLFELSIADVRTFIFFIMRRAIIFNKISSYISKLFFNNIINLFFYFYNIDFIIILFFFIFAFAFASTSIEVFTLYCECGFLSRPYFAIELSILKWIALHILSNVALIPFLPRLLQDELIIIERACYSLCDGVYVYSALHNRGTVFYF